MAPSRHLLIRVKRFTFSGTNSNVVSHASLASPKIGYENVCGNTCGLSRKFIQVPLAKWLEVTARESEDGGSNPDEN